MPIRALARVNLAAIERNAGLLRSRLEPSCELCAVVKADGYGHGAIASARAALAGGASWLAVATAAEALELRDAQVDAPILVMGALSPQELPVARAARADVVAWSEQFVDELAQATGQEARVHVKLDSGMGRLGTRDPEQALRVAERVARSAPGLRLTGAMTHFATADDDPEFLAGQLEAFRPFAAELRRRHPGVVVHAANSAATLASAESHFDLVRCGIALYGCDPANADPSSVGLEPALELTSYVAAVKPAKPGDSVGYGRRFIAQRPTWIATVPIGYADGIRRGLTNNCDVLIRGARYPLVGAVSMDNLTLDLGDTTDVQVGDTATIIGRDGPQRQTAEDLARRVDTINYEIVCGISNRVPRHYHHDGAPDA